jgi:hypothetical protein
MTVLRDPDHRITGLGFPPNHNQLVMRRGAKIAFRRQGDNTQFRPVIDQILAEP